MDQLTVGEIIRRRRLEIGMTQKELAAKAGYKDKTSITKIEAGLTPNIKREQIISIARALDMPAIDLIGLPKGWDMKIDLEEIAQNQTEDMIELTKVLKRNKESVPFLHELMLYAKFLEGKINEGNKEEK